MRGPTVNPKKHRTPVWASHISEDAILAGALLNPDGTLIAIGVDGQPLIPTSCSMGISYDRPKGPKTTVQVPVPIDHSPEKGMDLGRFTRIIGVDTSYREHDGELVCVTTMCELRDLVIEGRNWRADADARLVFEFRDPIKDPERLGWWIALGACKQSGWLSADQRVLLVVDAHLKEHHSINERTSSIIDRYFLPSCVSLAYASSDTQTDTVLNWLIAFCDKVSRLTLMSATAPETPDDFLLEERLPCTASRFWVADMAT